MRGARLLPRSAGRISMWETREIGNTKLNIASDVYLMGID